MKKRIIYTLLFFGTAIIVPFGITGNSELQGTEQIIRTGMWEGRTIEYIHGEAVVKLGTTQSLALSDSIYTSHNLIKVATRAENLKIETVKLPGNVLTLPFIEKLKKSNVFEWIEPVRVGRFHAIYPNEYPTGDFEEQWHLQNTGQSPTGGTMDADIDLPEAWELERGGYEGIQKGGRIGILDSGFPINGGWNHEDLNDIDRFNYGHDPTGGFIALKDSLGHGTHVTGIAAAETNNTVGVAGVAWNSEVYLFKVGVLYQNWTPYLRDDWVLSAVNAAVNTYGCKVLNMSFGFSPSPTLLAAVNCARSAGAVIVASVGNDYYTNLAKYPASYSSGYDNVIAVAATNPDDYKAEYSNCADEVTIAAPGGSDPFKPGVVETDWIFSTAPGYAVLYTYSGPLWGATDTYAWLAGTSMAAPVVTGVAGLIMDANPHLSPAQVRGIITSTADLVHSGEYDQRTGYQYDYSGDGRNRLVGYGRINAAGALASVPVTGLHPELVPNDPLRKEQEADRPPTSYTVHLSWETHHGDKLHRYRVDKSVGAPDDWYAISYKLQPQYGDWVVCDDTDVMDDVHYYYRIQVVDEYLNAQYGLSEVVHTHWVGGGGGPEEAAAESNADHPTDLILDQNYPNPFNPTTAIRFGLPATSHVRLRIMNIRGQTVRILADGEKSAGWHTVTWDGKDEAGQDVASGIYLYLLEAGNKPILRRMTIMR